MKFTSLVFIFLSVFALNAHAQLTVSKSTVELSESSPRSIVRISNSSADTLYVNLDIDEVVSPATDESLRKPVDVLADPEILVLPQQMMLEPGQTKLVRIITTNTNIESDKVYRLNVVPFAGQPLSDSNIEKSVGVKILLGYKLLVLVRPETISPSIEFTQSDSAMMFNNTGNTSVLLREIEACNVIGEDCEKILSNRLYPGEQYKVDLPKRLQSQSLKVTTRQFVNLTESLVEY